LTRLFVMHRANGTADLYEVLGVPSDADPPTIRRVYRERARMLPLEVSSKDENRDQLRELTHAYEVLSNPHSRRVYDRHASGDGQRNGEWAQPEDEQLLAWVFGAADTKEPRGARVTFTGRDLLVRSAAAVGLVLGLLLLAVLLLVHG
jgi:DnaJ-class molecular chaperone